ncbi:MAG: hypothetical protein RLZZ127_1444 [Planctomycetota bacterium]|jgi:RNA polymerase sigma-70 factor (ECF subfamily)
MMAGAPQTGTDFEARWAEAATAVAGFIRALVADRRAADDLVQEVAVQAYRHRDGWRREAPFTAWCLGIARNVVRMHWRSNARERLLTGDPALLDRLAAEAAALADEVDDDGEQRALRACLEDLPRPSAELVRLHYVEDLPPTEIAARLAAAPGAVRVRLHRLRAALRTCIERRLARETGDG